MIHQYENVVIYTPVLSEDQLKEAVVFFKGILKNNGAEIVHEESWGLRKLAYPIKKKSTGFYNIIEFKAAGDLIQKMEIEMTRDERVLRFLTVKLDKHAVQYNIKRRIKLKEPKKTVKKKEEVVSNG